jgi:hypothetical protein
MSDPHRRTDARCTPMGARWVCPACDGTLEHVGEVCAHPIHDRPCVDTGARWWMLLAIAVVAVIMGVML